MQSMLQKNPEGLPERMRNLTLMKDSKPKTDLWILLGTMLVIVVLIIGMICHAFLSSDAEDSTEPAAESAEESVNLVEEDTETADSVS